MFFWEDFLYFFFGLFYMQTLLKYKVEITGSVEIQAQKPKKND